VTPEGLRALLEPAVLAALGGIAARYREDQIDEHLDELGEALAAALAGDSSWSLEITSVSVTRIERTPAENVHEGPFYENVLEGQFDHTRVDLLAECGDDHNGFSLLDAYFTHLAPSSESAYDPNRSDHVRGLALLKKLRDDN